MQFKKLGIAILAGRGLNVWVPNAFVSFSMAHPEQDETQPNLLLSWSADFTFPRLLQMTSTIMFSGTGNRIFGEVYEVDDTILSDLDVLEEVPDFYSRDPHRVTSLRDGSEMTAWIYSIKNFKHELLELPTITEYHSNGLYNADYFSNADYSHRKEILKL